jgi:hypothetical protein
MHTVNFFMDPRDVVFFPDVYLQQKKWCATKLKESALPNQGGSLSIKAVHYSGTAFSLNKIHMHSTAQAKTMHCPIKESVTFLWRITDINLVLKNRRIRVSWIGNTPPPLLIIYTTGLQGYKST